MMPRKAIEMKTLSDPIDLVQTSLPVYGLRCSKNSESARSAVTIPCHPIIHPHCVHEPFGTQVAVGWLKNRPRDPKGIHPSNPLSGVVLHGRLGCGFGAVVGEYVCQGPHVLVSIHNEH